MGFISPYLLFNNKENNPNKDIMNESDTTHKTSRSPIYDILEFNENMHKIEVEDELNYYRALAESCNTSDPSRVQMIEEGYLENFKDKITEIIKSIIEWINDNIISIFDVNNMAQLRFERVRKKSRNFMEYIDDINKEYTFTWYAYPSIYEFGNNLCDDALSDILKNIDSICNGTAVADATGTTLKLAYTKLAASISHCARSSKTSTVRSIYKGPIETLNQFKVFINANILYRFEEKGSYRSWVDDAAIIKPVDKNTLRKKISSISNRLNEYEKKINRITDIDNKQRSNIKIYLGQVKSIVSAYEWFLSDLMKIRTNHMKYVANTYNKIARSNSVNMEAGYIHGEEFNSETLFGNEDLRDFNRTEWLDVALESELYAMSYEFKEVFKRCALNEALMRTDAGTEYESFLELNKISTDKIKAIVIEIIKNMKRFFDEHISEIRDKYSKEARYIAQNSNIFNKPFTVEVASYADLFAGMARIQANIDPKPYNYDTMKNDLKDPKTFFIKYIKPEMEKYANSIKGHRMVKWDDNMSISEYCNMFFGNKTPEQKEKFTFTVDALNANKNKIKDYVSNPNKILSGIRSDINKLEVNARRASAGMTSSFANPPEANNSTKSESFYSYLYDDWFNEADIKNTQDNSTPENKQNNNSEKSDGVPDEATAVKVYIRCYKEVYAAKLSACRFILSEFSDLIHAHIKMNGGKIEEKKEN